MKYKYNDGGREQAGYKGNARDCVTRAISIASGLPYKQVYKDINSLAKEMRVECGARTGVPKTVYAKYLDELGFEWVPTMRIGSGCKVHLVDSELPTGKIIVRLSRHLCAVVDGVINDTYDCSRGGSRCVYGYWIKGE